MAFTVGTQVEGASFSGTLTVTLPTYSAGNTVFIHFSSDNSARMPGGAIGPTNPAGWTELHFIEEGGGSHGASLYYRKMDGSEGTTVSWGGSMSANNLAWVSIPVSGADTTTPVNTSSEKVNNTSTTVTGVAITPSVADCLIMEFVTALVSNGDGTTVSGYTLATSPPTFTERYDRVGNALSLQSLATGVRPETTSTGSPTATLSASKINTMITVALTPGPVATGNPAFFMNFL